MLDAGDETSERARDECSYIVPSAWRRSSWIGTRQSYSSSKIGCKSQRPCQRKCNYHRGGHARQGMEQGVGLAQAGVAPAQVKAEK